MLWEGPTPTAVLDWEMACLGPAEVDLAWMIFLHAFFQNMAETYGMPGLPNFMRRSEMAALYTEMSGRSVEALEWFEVFAALRFATVSVRTTTRGVEYGQMEPPAELRRRHHVPRLARADARRQLLGRSLGLSDRGVRGPDPPKSQNVSSVTSDDGSRYGSRCESRG